MIPKDGKVKTAGLTLDLDGRRLRGPAGAVKLNPKECRLLAVFMNYLGEVLSRKLLMKRVWDTDYVGDTRTLEVHVCWLRRKLKEVSGGTPRLVAVRRVGYRLEEQHFDGLSTSSETPDTANRLPNILRRHLF